MADYDQQDDYYDGSGGGDDYQNQNQDDDDDPRGTKRKVDRHQDNEEDEEDDEFNAKRDWVPNSESEVSSEDFTSEEDSEGERPAVRYTQKRQAPPPPRAPAAPRGGYKGPKKPMASFMFYCQEQRPLMKRDNPDATFGELGKLLGAAWRRLTEDEKAPYAAMNAQDKIRYAQEVSASGLTEEELKRPRAPKRQKVERPKGPKRPMTAYQYFCQDHDGPNPAEAWDNMDEEEQAPYVAKNTRLLRRYNELMDLQIDLNPKYVVPTLEEGF